MYARGLPDILLVYKGIPVLIEVKRPGGTPTKLQAMELMKFEKAGAVSLVMDSVKDVEPLVARLDEMVDRRDSSWRTHQIDWRREFNIKITI